MAILTDSPQFGSVLDRRGSDKRLWWFVLPGVVLLGALLVVAGVTISRSSGLATQAKLAQQQAAEAQKAVEERDKLLQKARADEDLLRSAGQGAAILAAAAPDGPASGVALYHPERRALKLYAFGLAAPPAGKEYRVEALAGEERTSLGKVAPDERGTAFLLLRDVPEGTSEVAVRLAPARAEGPAKEPANGGEQPEAREVTEAGAEPEGEIVLAGALPKTGEGGVVAAPPVQGRAPPAARRPR